MRIWTTCIAIALLGSAATQARAEDTDRSEAVHRTEKAQRLLSAVQKEDAALRKRPDKLRFRHHIERQIRRWRLAKKVAGDTRWYEEAHRGEVEALALLAHWSGLQSDHRRARAARRRLQEAASAEKPARLAAQDAPSPSASIPSVATAELASPQAARSSDAPATDAKALALRSSEPDAPDRPCAEAVEIELSVLATPPPDFDDLFQVRTIVLDPGHGGEEHGAHGPAGLLEKDVNLAIAREVRRLLQGTFQIVMTREDDRTVGLAERSRLANREDADLFISIHANAHRQSRFHGIETYVLDVDSRRYPTRLRDRESREETVDLGDAPVRQDVKLLLADLAMRGATRQSRRLAELVQSRLVGTLRRDHPGVVDLGVKSALFYVLLGTRMPSVLVETGFLTHAEEGERLGQPAYRKRIAQGIADAILEYASQRERWVAQAGPHAFSRVP